MDTILFLTADPSDAARLRLGEEFREIREQLQLSKHREKFRLEQRTSVRPQDITLALLDYSPRFVHFSGHGDDGALWFENTVGEIHPIHPEAVASLLEQFPEVECVVMNACYSATQAESIAKHISFVIGMSGEIEDKASIAFSIGFYQALGAGRTIEEAYSLGCAQIQLHNLPDYLIPVLIRKNNAIGGNPPDEQHVQMDTGEEEPSDLLTLQPDGPTGGREPRNPSATKLIAKVDKIDDFVRKRIVYEEVVLQDPNDPVGFRLLAWSLQKTKDYSSAIRYDLEAIRLDPNYAKSYVGLILSGNRTGDYSLVMRRWDDLQKVCDLRQRPFHEGAYWYADAQQKFGNFKEAIRWFEHIITGDWWKPLNDYEQNLLTKAQAQIITLKRSTGVKSGY